MPYKQKSRAIESVDHLRYDFQRFVLKHFVQHIEAQSGKPILIYVYGFEEHLLGMWIPQEDANYIIINKSVHPIHKIHNILHEIAHIVLDHPRLIVEDMLPPDLLQQLNIKDVKGCARYVGKRNNTPEEREAEEFVFYIQEQVFKHRRSQELTVIGSSIDLLRPLLDISAY